MEVRQAAPVSSARTILELQRLPTLQDLGLNAHRVVSDSCKLCTSTTCSVAPSA